jgi:hypothetical protein
MILGRHEYLKTIFLRSVGAILVVTFVPARAQTRQPIDLEKAGKAFSEAEQISSNDAGRLWGTLLYGPMLLVDPETRAVVANEPDAQGLLHPERSLYVGTLPESVPIADAPTEWAGKRWTMLRWPLPEDTLTRRVEFAHEMFHRIQPELHLNAPDTLNSHLDTAEGRLWLELEWRALAAALIESGQAQTQAISDALSFRNHRHEMFRGSAESERNLEIAEGIAEYTGLSAGAPDGDTALAHNQKACRPGLDSQLCAVIRLYIRPCLRTAARSAPAAVAERVIHGIRSRRNASIDITSWNDRFSRREGSRLRPNCNPNGRGRSSRQG